MSDDVFTAKVSTSRTSLLIVGSVAFVLAGLWFVFNADEIAATTHQALLQSSEIVRAVGIVAVLFFGACGVIGARQLLRTDPVIEIDATGILWRRWSPNVIPWDAIERISLTQMISQRFVSLWLVDPAAYPARGTMGRLAGANRSMGYGDIAIAPAGLDKGATAIMAAIERFGPATLAR